MRLQQLVIKGFKSFANETVINFQEDVIGIVGPNGSGKSNIVDAVRWVLGEQKSRELRLDQMSSVIFNGTKKKKAGKIAQVSLTFENSKNVLPTEYQNVTIERLLYRTGESEYRLNGVTCRLKDITSLFLDTGIGSNSYAIIALGMVDDILADKENARRRMFEQAAGISKYKRRKHETLNKLKSTEADLDRVEDLLFEIEGNLKSLEKQAKRTKRFYELKDKYKDNSIELARHKVEGIKESQASLNKRLTEEQDKYRALEIAIHQIEAALESERKSNLDQEKSLSQRQRDLNEQTGLIRQQENEKAMLAQRLQFIQQQRSRRENEIQQGDQRQGQLQEEISNYQTRIEAEQVQEKALKATLDEAAASLEATRASHSDLKGNLEAMLQEQQNAERQVFEYEKQRAINENQLRSLELEGARSQEESEQRKLEMEAVNDSLKKLQEREDAQAKLVEQLEQEREARLQQLETLQKDLEKATQKLQKVNRELDAKRNEYKLTQSMIENLEGFPESIRFLSNNKDWEEKASLLSDVIYVPEAYRVAIENYLEPYLNYYVVPDMETATAAIRLLGKSQKGKANFFLLDAFKGYEPPMRMLPGAKRAAELVETEAQYAPLVNYLLENVLITDQEDLPQHINTEDFVLLARSGRFIQRRYSLSGGSIGLFEGKKIGRKKNLELLEATIAKAEREENRLSTEFFQIKRKIEALQEATEDTAIQAERKKLSAIAQERVSLATRYESFSAFLQAAAEKQAAAKAQEQQLIAKNEELAGLLAQQKEVLAEINQRNSQADDSFQVIADQLSQASAAYNDQNIAFIRQQNTVQALEREKEYRGRQLNELKTNLEQATKDVEQSGADIRTIEDKRIALEESLKAAYQKRDELQAFLGEAEQAYFQARGDINEQEKALSQKIKSRQDAQVLVNNLKDKATSLKFEMDSVSQRLQIEFNIKLADLPAGEIEFKLNAEELQLKVDRLRNRLDNYGEINPMAVEAYDEMKERYEAIVTQRDDINEAKASLIETIKEIEETATTQFLDAFERARLFFIDVFRSLFTEDDTCDLILLEPEKPLESKIEIVAKPKGKRPQTISQLSGGEKTLTAIALLFALYLLKPAPFCVFDEVDAPLDDANIEKFNRIIKKFSSNSQFIIVTHNKLTMAAVDTIYGVFMAEQGVSGVTAVDFRQFEQTGTFAPAAAK